MKTVTFNNTYYHFNEQMKEWCRVNVGTGNYTGLSEDSDLWSTESMFGTTRYHFKNDEDADKFRKVWE